jgi:hypothetical protein
MARITCKRRRFNVGLECYTPTVTLRILIDPLRNDYPPILQAFSETELHAHPGQPPFTQSFTTTFAIVVAASFARPFEREGFRLEVR